MAEDEKPRRKRGRMGNLYEDSAAHQRHPPARLRARLGRRKATQPPVDGADNPADPAPSKMINPGGKPALNHGGAAPGFLQIRNWQDNDDQQE